MELLWALHLYVYIRMDPGWEKGWGGVYIENFNVRMCFRLTDGCSVLQAEISAIRRAAKWLMFHRIFEFDILIVTDSQAAIKSLTGMYTTSSLVQECRASLNEMARHTNVTLKWVRGHGSDRGNDTADELARRGQPCRRRTSRPSADCPSLHAGGVLGFPFWNGHSRDGHWSPRVLSRGACGLVWTWEGQGCYWDFLEHILGWLCLLSQDTALSHARRLGLPYNDFCRSCHDEDEEETVLHLLGTCRALGASVLGFCGE
ncbi:hypothetical protein EVAR_74051_1 [Eumeta japonica]|uniref:RNase H type-1 domain-containing protein n=1 Tax=Eumeta variegata TaxID=151549 RepID=A0A4C1TDZ9_EUMVA|nr:hypothetical protein EVAR_74051_1 [Eumeta japonica]